MITSGQWLESQGSMAPEPHKQWPPKQTGWSWAAWTPSQMVRVRIWIGGTLIPGYKNIVNSFCHQSSGLRWPREETAVSALNQLANEFDVRFGSMKPQKSTIILFFSGAKSTLSMSNVWLHPPCYNWLWIHDMTLHSSGLHTHIIPDCTKLPCRCYVILSYYMFSFQYLTYFSIRST